MTAACNGPECDRPVRARGYCRAHYRQFLKTGTVKKLRGSRKSCRVDGCGRPAHAKELCPKHYERVRANGMTETVRTETNREFQARMKRGEKTCADCEAVKPLEDFYRSSFTRDGRIYLCKSCVSAKQRDWHKSHREENRERAHVRRTLERSGPGIDIDALWAASSGECPDCGIALIREAEYPSKHFGSVDHMIPISKGGPHDQSNVRLTCLSCNFRKSAKMPHEYTPKNKEIA